MTGHWERVRHVVRCAYGCGEVKHPEWVYLRGRFAVCEPCAAKMDIRRPVFGPQDDAPKEPHNLVPANSPRRNLSSVGTFADDLKAAPSEAAFLAKLRRLVGRS